MGALVQVLALPLLVVTLGISHLCYPPSSFLRKGQYVPAGNVQVSVLNAGLVLPVLQGSSATSPWTVWVGGSVCGAVSLLCGMFTSIPGLHSRDARSSALVVTTKNVSGHCQVSPGGQNGPTESHCSANMRLSQAPRDGLGTEGLPSRRLLPLKG